LSTPRLFSPLALRATTLKNRIAVSPMCQYRAVEGRVQDWHFMHHARFALGGSGLIFVEATAVMRDGRITHGCTGIWEHGQVAGLRRIADMHRLFGAAPAIQIGHSGRRGSAAAPWDGARPLNPKGADGAWQTVAPSPVAEQEGYPLPRELSASEIGTIVAAFASAARRALAAGFEVLEIHGAHGYLLHSFFSPHSNRRGDEFGGSRDKRMRVPLMVSEAVRRVWPGDKPLFYRVSAVDGVEGGLEIADSIALARELKRLGIDVIDCSSGGMAGAATLSPRKIRPGFQVPFAEAIRLEAGIATMAVGAILDGRQAEAIVAEGKADLVAIGREMLADADWAYHAGLALGLDNPHAVLPPQYGFYLERRARVLER
jgi:2,4-dienoyl-CoA reductase-like NADH-dependent reductase (Old Yellow Enzyme family)